jgi:hypothetical protein
MSIATVDLAQIEREREVENALASVRLEGLEPSTQAKGIFQRYAEGDLSIEEMGRAVDEILNRNYGPVRLSGNERP